VKQQAKVFLAGPPLIKAATGEIADAEELGGAAMHTGVSGVGEYFAVDDADGIRQARDIVRNLDWDAALPAAPQPDYQPPLYDIGELCGVVSADGRKPYDCREVIARLVDGSDFVEF